MQVKKTENGRLRVGVDCSDSKDRTQQTHRKQCDINTIVSRAFKTGFLPITSQKPMYGDFTGAKDFTDSRNAIQAAEREFLKLKPEIRARFKNDVSKMLGFLEDEKNYEEGVKLGLLEKRKTVNPDKQPPEGNPPKTEPTA